MRGQALPRAQTPPAQSDFCREILQELFGSSPAPTPGSSRKQSPQRQQPAFRPKILAEHSVAPQPYFRAATVPAERLPLRLPGQAVPVLTVKAPPVQSQIVAKVSANSLSPSHRLRQCLAAGGRDKKRPRLPPTPTRRGARNPESVKRSRRTADSPRAPKVVAPQQSIVDAKSVSSSWKPQASSPRSSAAGKPANKGRSDAAAAAAAAPTVSAVNPPPLPAARAQSIESPASNAAAPAPPAPNTLVTEQSTSSRAYKPTTGGSNPMLIHSGVSASVERGAVCSASAAQEVLRAVPREEDPPLADLAESSLAALGKMSKRQRYRERRRQRMKAAALLASSSPPIRSDDSGPSCYVVLEASPADETCGAPDSAPATAAADAEATESTASGLNETVAAPAQSTADAAVETLADAVIADADAGVPAGGETIAAAPIATAGIPAKGTLADAPPAVPAAVPAASLTAPAADEAAPHGFSGATVANGAGTDGVKAHPSYIPYSQDPRRLHEMDGFLLYACSVHGVRIANKTPVPEAWPSFCVTSCNVRNCPSCRASLETLLVLAPRRGCRVENVDSKGDLVRIHLRCSLRGHRILTDDAILRQCKSWCAVCRTERERQQEEAAAAAAARRAEERLAEEQAAAKAQRVLFAAANCMRSCRTGEGTPRPPTSSDEGSSSTLRLEADIIAKVLSTKSTVPWEVLQLQTPAFWRAGVKNSLLRSDSAIYKLAKARYRELIKLVHPDKNSHSAATEAFRKLTDAWKQITEAVGGDRCN